MELKTKFKVGDRVQDGIRYGTIVDIKLLSLPDHSEVVHYQVQWDGQSYIIGNNLKLVQKSEYDDTDIDHDDRVRVALQPLADVIYGPKVVWSSVNVLVKRALQKIND